MAYRHRTGRKERERAEEKKYKSRLEKGRPPNEKKKGAVPGRRDFQEIKSCFF